MKVAFVLPVIAALLAGCGGGSGGGSDFILTGDWRRVSIGPTATVELSLVPCPNSTTSEGETVKCRASDALTLGADNKFVLELTNSSGQLVRRKGTYGAEGSRVVFTQSERGTDFDGSGTIEPLEITSPVLGSTLTMQIVESSASKMRVQITLDGKTHTSLYVR